MGEPLWKNKILGTLKKFFCNGLKKFLFYYKVIKNYFYCYFERKQIMKKAAFF